MRNIITLITSIGCLIACVNAYTIDLHTLRTSLLATKTVNVWKTIIYPDSAESLKMHRHDHDRVLVALNTGTLKVTNDKGSTRYVKLSKDHVYYLTKDSPNEFHTDTNVSKHPLKVIVVELKN